MKSSKLFKVLENKRATAWDYGGRRFWKVAAWAGTEAGSILPDNFRRGWDATVRKPKIQKMPKAIIIKH
jgi:hypothetical protein